MYVCISQCFSAAVGLQHDIPQDSILGPLGFLDILYPWCNFFLSMFLFIFLLRTFKFTSLCKWIKLHSKSWKADFKKTNTEWKLMSQSSGSQSSNLSGWCPSLLTLCCSSFNEDFIFQSGFLILINPQIVTSTTASCDKYMFILPVTCKIRVISTSKLRLQR